MKELTPEEHINGLINLLSKSQDEVGNLRLINSYLVAALHKISQRHQVSYETENMMRHQDMRDSAWMKDIAENALKKAGVS